jgi:hypothetical protein
MQVQHGSVCVRYSSFGGVRLELICTKPRFYCQKRETLHVYINIELKT